MIYLSSNNKLCEYASVSRLGGTLLIRSVDLPAIRRIKMPTFILYILPDASFSFSPPGTGGVLRRLQVGEREVRPRDDMLLRAVLRLLHHRRHVLAPLDGLRLELELEKMPRRGAREQQCL